MSSANPNLTKPRDVTLTVALCASLAVHALLSIAMCEQYVRSIGSRIFLPAIQRDIAADAMEANWLPVFDPDQDPMRQLGDAAGEGYAIDDSPGEDQLLARQAPIDQPFLSRDPVGLGRVGDEPSENLIPGGGARESIAPPPTALSTPAVPAAPEMETPLIGIGAAALAPPRAPVPAATVPISESATESNAAASSEVPRPRIAADPAPKGESEVDPFSTIGSVEFRRGSTVVRFGRKHKLTRPKFSLAAEVDLVSMPPSKIVLKIATNSQGDVSSVRIQHSSGSESLDQIVQVTAYEWWFEPPLDADGNPKPDEFLFTIGLR